MRSPFIGEGIAASGVFASRPDQQVPVGTNFWGRRATAFGRVLWQTLGKPEVVIYVPVDSRAAAMRCCCARQRGLIRGAGKRDAVTGPKNRVEGDYEARRSRDMPLALRIFRYMLTQCSRSPY